MRYARWMLIVLLASAAGTAMPGIEMCPPAEDMKPAGDPTYGYSKKNPIVVGHIGPKNMDAFLSQLRGPNGEELTWERAGSCCTFKSPQSLYRGQADLEKMRVRIAGVKKPILLYFNGTDCAVPMIPDGFTSP